MSKKYTIFINHPSPYMTDCEPHGDGLLAYQYIDRLARRGHELYVAAPIVKLREPLHYNVRLFVIKTMTGPSCETPSRVHRLEYALRVRHLFQELQANTQFDIIHQLNPVMTWVNLFLPVGNIPFVVGPVVPPWPVPELASRLGVIGYLRSISQRLLHWGLYRRASCILVANPSGAHAVPNSLSIPSRIRLSHYGIDTEQFAPEENSLAADERGPQILFLANLHRRKGIYTLLQAFESVIKSVPRARLTIAGDGPEHEEVKRVVSAMASSNRISMLGAIAHDDVPDLLHSCSVYCLPSYGEPFGMSALEAMSCGKPVVATAAGGLNYLVDDRGGVKVPVGDSEKLAAALIRLLKGPQLCSLMGKYNRQVAVSSYDWDLVISSLEQTYEQTIQGR